MKLSALFLVLVTLVPSWARASALVIKDDQQGTLRFVTQIHYQGKALTPQIAYAASAEISRLWNEPKVTVQFRGKPYRVRFVIGYSVNERYRFLRDSGSCEDNFVQVENLTNPGDRSFYQLFGRIGTFYTSDDLGNSTTVAHEYGHGLGLEHDDYDQRSAPVPGIMFARGTLVRPEFQWNPAALPGNPGGSINPKFRRVRVQDVAKIDLRSLQFSGNYACLGQGIPLPTPLSNAIPANLKAPPRVKLEGISSPDVESERASEAHDH